MRVSSDMLKDMVKCMGRLESATHQLYHDIAIRMTNRKAGWIMEFIAMDSWKHYMLYIDILGVISGGEISGEEADCKKAFGEVFANLLELEEKLDKEVQLKHELSDNDVLSMLSSLESIEVMAGEESFMNVITTLLAKSGFLNESGGIEEVLSLISEDERRHAKLLEKVKGLLRQI
jgi:hypothetical protein